MNKTPIIISISLCIYMLAIQVSASGTNPILNNKSSNINNINEIPLTELMKLRSSLYIDSDTASGTSESVRDAPGAMVVIDQKMISRRGYDSLDDILQDLPGFDTVVTNGTMQTVTYQRGYRTPWTQRTLLLIDGRVDNNLWNHSAQISRQYPVNIIKRIEVLYGPAGAVYGPNAFLGVINIITRDSSWLADGESYLETSFQAGSYNTHSIDLATGSRSGVLSYSLAAKLFSSDEADIDNYSEWGYTDPGLLNDPAIWGAGIGNGIDPFSGNPSPTGDTNLDGMVSPYEEFNGKPLGEYADPTNDIGVLGELTYKNINFGFMMWETNEAYGPYYSFTDAQPNASWVHESKQLYVEHSSKESSLLNINTELVYRQSRVGGDWVESFDDFVSISDWNSYNTAWRLEQKYNYKMSDTLQVNGGIKYEQKKLTKTYMICNYYDGTGVCPEQAANSSTGVSSDGTGVIEADLIDSTNPLSFPPSLIDNDIPTNNLINTTDIGGYIQAIWDRENWRYNASVRIDDNSEYGTEINPRVAAIYNKNTKTTYKTVYGEAIQEPSPKDLYGGFSGRLANPDLVPEKVRNLEFIVLHQSKYLLHDVSIFYAEYSDAIAGGQNVGDRKISGLEYRGKYKIANFISDSPDITGNLYYTYTNAKSEQQYDNQISEWIEKEDDQGDIAPHKINLMVNIPVKSKWNLNFSANWVSERELFSQNPLRSEYNSAQLSNVDAESYVKFDANILYENKNISVGVKVENIFEEEYLLPGVEGAGSGNDFAVDSDGFQNSLIPQTKERIYLINVKIKI